MRSLFLSCSGQLNLINSVQACLNEITISLLLWAIKFGKFGLAVALADHITKDGLAFDYCPNYLHGSVNKEVFRINTSPFNT